MGEVAKVMLQMWLSESAHWWTFFQKPSTKHDVQERLISATATTGTLFRKSISKTKEKVVALGSGV